MDDVFNSGREQEDEIITDVDDHDDGSRYLNDSGEGMFEEGEEEYDLQLTIKFAKVYIYINI